MIVTILLLLKKIIEFARKHRLNDESLIIDLIESSTNSSDSLTDSMIVFFNCKSVHLNEIQNDREFLKDSYRDWCPRRSNRKKSQRLNTIKKMDYEEDGNRELLNGIMAGLKGNLISPASDCNSNNLTMPKDSIFLNSTDSIHDCPDFLQDNSDYQWFLDYGYKDNNYSHHQSILSLSRSQDLVYYEDMARNIDANLAEVDMDDFNREDIHSVLSTLPNIPGVEEREMFASVSESVMIKLDFDSPISPHSNSQEEQINCTSICKSQILFSPVRESYLPNANLSVDSLDLSENDINLMVTCQANTNNYTIAFEGSTVMASDDSESRDTGDSGGSTSVENEITRYHEELSRNEQAAQRFASAHGNLMARSDSTFTTWSKIKENSSENLQLRRHPSGNNNTNVDTHNIPSNISSSSAVKSLSLPNLFRQKHRQSLGMSVSVKLSSDSESNSLDSEQRCIKLYDIQNSCNSKSVDHSNLSASGKPPHNFSLVKLFIKQKSASHEGMSSYTTEQTWSNSKSPHENVQLENTQNLDENCFKNNRVNEMNKINKINTNNCSFAGFDGNSKKVDKTEARIPTEMNNANCTKKIIQTSAHEKLSQKHILPKTNEKKQNSYDFSREKYCSDESTQENGSNTESAENLTCNCITSPNFGNKKLLTEKSIQTSKVLETVENSQKKQMKVPVYILYPNYSLPNLEFLRKEHYVQNIDFSKVFLRPQKFKTPGSPVASPKASARAQGRRPFSVNDIESLKKTGFKHVKDWESLTFLLPKEYKQFLQEIPEIVAQLKDAKSTKEDLVPLFCLSPPPNRRVRKRPNSCDVNFFNGDFRSSNFSSTATQPSSGYRGSSTMLNSNNSNGANSPRINTFGYKYDSGSDSGSSRRSGSLSHNKNYFTGSGNSNDTPPPRPPLPRSILRNNSLDNPQYTCKTQKENANKRYSMIELNDKNLLSEERSGRRRSDLKLVQASESSNEQNRGVPESRPGSNKKSRERKSTESEDNYGADVKSNLENDMRRLEELLEISAVFGESVESFTESDMLKLRSQVSKFLTMQKNLEKVSETLQTVDEATINKTGGNKNANVYEDNNSLIVKQSHTPHNTPEHKKQAKGVIEKNERDLRGLVGCDGETFSKPCDCYGQLHEFEEGDCKYMEGNIGGLKKTVSFAEKISFAVKEQEAKGRERTPPNSPSLFLASQKHLQTKSKRPIDLPICEESLESMPNESPTRNQLQNSSELLHKRDLILDVRNAVEKILKLTDGSQEDPANICLHHLCPSLYAVLSDGLKEEIDTPFGPIRNSVWSVIEASSQHGPMTQTLNELVQRLNRDDIFTEGLIKFNAFIFGLLNARALSGWFSYLRTRDSLLRKYYDNSGLFLMSNTSGASARVLVDQLISIIETLCSVQFNLDLMYQTKLLHCSLQNLNCLLEESGKNDFLTPTKQFMLLKLVQSIQNSLSQSGEGKKSKHTIEDIDQKTSDPPVGHLLEKNKIVRTRRGPIKTRPRSGCDTVGGAQGITDVAGMMKKRWSTVHANSKLVEAFEKLGTDSESDYTDSLDNARPRRGLEKAASVRNIPKRGSEPNLKTRDFESDVYTKEQKKNILLNLNKKSSGKVENCKTASKETESLEDSMAQLPNGGDKFKRLQQKWEKLSGRSASDSDSESKSPPLHSTPTRKTKSASSINQVSERTCCDTNISSPSPTSRISKIPRLVTSPLSSASSTKQLGYGKKIPSPTSFHQKTGKVSYSSEKKANSAESRASATPGSRLSRYDEKTEAALNPSAGKNHAIRPTSLPYRGCSTMPAKKSDPISRRASSMSLNRKPAPKKLQHVPRTVRTLTHRLPSDSGHLSFNENEKLKVVLEVDKTWLLCCRGNQKGLVPKSAVISDIEDNKF